MSRIKKTAFWNPCTDSSDDEGFGQNEEKIPIKKTCINKDAIKSSNDISSDLDELKNERSNTDDLIRQEEEENGEVNTNHVKKRKNEDSDVEENTNELFF